MYPQENEARTSESVYAAAAREAATVDRSAGSGSRVLIGCHNVDLLNINALAKE